MTERISAIFASEEQAEAAVNELRRLELSDNRIAIVTRHSGGDHRKQEVETGLVAGAGLGAIFGLAAFLIPGVGPFIAAGSLAPVLVNIAGGAAAGAIAGGAGGLLESVLERAGFARHEAEYFGSQLEEGAHLVVADIDSHQYSAPQIHEIFAQHGGQPAPEPKAI